LSETWLERKEWERVKGRLPKGYKWGVQGARREGKRGRATGRMIMGIREELVDGEIKIEEGIEGTMMSEIRVGKERWRIIGVYISEGIENMTRKIERWTDKGEKNRKLMIGGDFNARVGEEGGGFEGEDGENRGRKAKDGVTNTEGRRLLYWVEENGWSMFNGCMKGDKEGEFTFTKGRGSKRKSRKSEDRGQDRFRLPSGGGKDERKRSERSNGKERKENLEGDMRL